MLAVRGDEVDGCERERLECWRRGRWTRRPGDESERSKASGRARKAGSVLGAACPEDDKGSGGRREKGASGSGGELLASRRRIQKGPPRRKAGPLAGPSRDRSVRGSRVVWRAWPAAGAAPSTRRDDAGSRGRGSERAVSARRPAGVKHGDGPQTTRRCTFVAG